MRKAQKGILVCIGIFLYLVIGWNIGKLKYDLWYGRSGLAALSQNRDPKSLGEFLMRDIFFPASAQLFSALRQGVIIDFDVNGPLVTKLRYNPLRYKALHAVVGLPATIVWLIVFKFLLPLLTLCLAALKGIFFSLFP